MYCSAAFWWMWAPPWPPARSANCRLPASILYFSPTGTKPPWADKFGARFVDALEGDICRTQAFTPESLAAIAARELNHLAQRVKAQCGLVLAMGSDVRNLVAAQYGKTSGMTAMRDYVDSIYRAFAEYVLDADDIPTAGTPAKLTVDGSRSMAGHWQQ